MKVWMFVPILIGSQLSLGQPQPDTLWTRQFGSDRDETVYALSPDGQGGYVLAGHLGYNGDEIGPQDIFVYRTDADGDSIGSQIIGVPEVYEFAHAMCLAENGDILLAGMQWTGSGANSVARLIRLDAGGNTIYDHTFGSGNDRARFYAVQELPNGNVIAAGNHDAGDLNVNAYVVCVNAAGDTVWTRSLGDTLRENITEMLLNEQGQIVLSGTASPVSPPFESSYIRVMGLDLDGNPLWTRLHTSGPEMFPFTMDTQLANLENGDMAITSSVFNGTMAVAWLMRVTFSGDSLWAYTYHFGPISNFSYDVCAGAGGGITAVIGTIYCPSYELALINVDDAGGLVWEHRYALAGCSMWITGLRVCPNTSYLMSGTSFDNSNRYQVMLMMTGPEFPEATDQARLEVPSRVSLTAYPNPFNAETSLQLTLTRGAEGYVALYDIQGRFVKQLASGPFDAGRKMIPLRSADLASGVYFAAFNTEHSAQSLKLLLVK